MRALREAVHGNIAAVVQSRAGWRVAAALACDLPRGIETRKYIAEVELKPVTELSSPRETAKA